MPDVTFIIPIGPHHEAIADRAVTSAQVQTVPSTVIYVRDTDGRGPSWARNRGLEQAKDGFIVFLDADDWVEPTFVDRCLAVWRPNKYVYTDWYVGSEVRRAPDDAWCGDGQWHVITTLLTKGDVNRVGGFTELPGAEDTEFYWRLTRRERVCGVHLREPLFHYGDQGQRARQFVNSDQYAPTMQQIIRSYGNMGCCRDEIIQAGFDIADGEAGDVLAVAIWGGNKQVRGLHTGRLYPRAGNGKQVMVHPLDVQAAPHQWRLVPTIPPDVPTFKAPEPMPVIKANGFKAIAAALFDLPKPRQTLADIEAVARGPQQPDIDGILSMARARYE